MYTVCIRYGLLGILSLILSTIEQRDSNSEVKICIDTKGHQTVLMMDCPNNGQIKVSKKMRFLP